MIRRGIGVQPYTVGATPYIGLLDTYTGATAAYSVRKLRAAYTGSAIRVRRSSDNTEQDVGFDSNGNLDESALTTFVGANNGFVTTWYDQSANSNDVVQSTATQQPLIVSSGTIQKLNNKPVLNFDGINDFLTKTTPSNFSTGASNRALFSVAKPNRTTTVRSFLFSYGTAALNQTWAFDMNYPTVNYRIIGFNNDWTSNFLFSSTQQLFSMVLKNNTQDLQVNDAAIQTNAMTFNTTNSPLYIGNFTNGTTFCQMSCQEIIYYPLDQSTNRTGIKTNINTYYGIY